MGPTNPKRGENKGILAARRAERREAAEERQRERDQRSNEQQLALIKKRPGKSERESARLHP